MSVPTPTAKTAAKPAPFCLKEWAKKQAEPFMAPYYMVLFSILGAATTGFLVVIVLLIVVVANFSVIGFVE